MILYHGSPIGSLQQLRPYRSEHEEAYVYLSESPITALFYTVHPAEKPFSFSPYGFDQDGTIHYSEYYRNAFADIYKGQTGYLYVCEVSCPPENPTGIHGVQVCRGTVPVTREIVISDVYDQFLEYQAQGAFRIRTFDAIPESEMELVRADLHHTIETHHLIQFPDSSMSRWIRVHFPQVWEQQAACACSDGY